MAVNSRGPDKRKILLVHISIQPFTPTCACFTADYRLIDVTYHVQPNERILSRVVHASLTRVSSNRWITFWMEDALSERYRDHFLQPVNIRSSDWKSVVFNV